MKLQGYSDISLQALLNLQRLALPCCLRIAASLAGALAEEQAARGTYRALRPTKVSVDARSYRVHLVHLPDATPSSAAAPPTQQDEWAYLSPEQTGRMHRAVDYRTDFYSLGVILYRMLTGMLPFTASDPLEWVHCHIARLPRPPAELVPEVPAVVSDITMKLLAKMAEDRYQSATGLQADLERCLDQWERRGRIRPFPLGEHDISDRFQVPQKLYGRESETAVLQSAFARMAESGKPEMVLVTGSAGIGKSTLVHDLHSTVANRRGLLLSGKFDQYQRDIPYATISQAFRQLVQHILGDSEAEIAAWRCQVQDAVEANGRLLIDLIPQLELIIGPQPEMPELQAREAQYRFQLVFRRFLDVAATAASPLLLFLDDLQWADAGSLTLIQHVLTHPDTHHLMLVATCRDQDMQDNHPLQQTVEAIRKACAHQEIHLGALDAKALDGLVTDTLHGDAAAVTPLVELIRGKTEGNPFFVNQLLQKLHQDGLIFFDRERSAWCWDLERIKEANVTDNVVDLMACEIGKLPAATQEILKLAACLGTRFRSADLELVTASSPAEVWQRLQPALDKGLLLPAAGTPVGPMEANSCKWSHDRVQQAVYTSIPADDLARMHLAIGCTLRDGTSPRQRSERMFDIVKHLNAGAALIDDAAELTEIASLNLAAGRKAKASIAYASALTYFNAGLDLLCRAGENRYELVFPLRLEQAECELLNGKSEAAAQHVEQLLAQAVTRADKARTYRLKLQLHFLVGGKMSDAVQYEISGLAACGITLPPDPTQQDVIAACERVQHALGKRPIEALIDLPAMDDPELDAMQQLSPVSIFVNWNQGALRIANMVEQSLEHGNNDMSVFWYGAYGACIPGPVFGDYVSAHRYAVANCVLREKRGVLAHKAYAEQCAAITSFWVEPLDKVIARYQEAFKDAVEFGDFNTGNYCSSLLVFCMLNRGVGLTDAQAALQRAVQFICQNRAPDWMDVTVFTRQFISNLQGRTRDPHSFDGDGFDQAAFEATLTENRWKSVHMRYWSLRLRASFLFGAYRQAEAIGERAKAFYDWSIGTIEVRDYVVFHALTLAALYFRAPAQRAEWRATLQEHQAKLRHWSALNPDTFGHIEALVSAEIARIDGDPDRAAQLYEKSLEAARAGHFIHDQALAYELAARFYMARGFQAFAELYLCEARDGYARWGADGKVRQLEADYPQLRHLLSPARAASPLVNSMQQLDLLSIIKVSQAISGEIRLDALVDTLMRTVIENAGARQGQLLLAHKGEWALEAVASVEQQQVRISHRHVPGNPVDLPESVLNYVRRSKEQVLLADATEAHRFSADAYFSQRHPKSVLCLPILRQSELIGLLYLENDLATHAFTPNRIAVLELIASQAAISLENAQLFTELQKENSERRRAEEALREREARIRRLVESNIIGIFFWDTAGRISDANDAFLQIVGYSRRELLSGQVAWTTLTPEDYRDADQLALEELRRTGACSSYEKEYIRKDGSRVPILVGATFTEGSQETGVAFVLDLTERRQAEAERAARKSAEAANEAKSAFLANISHELRSPLNTLLGYSHLMQRRPSLPRDVRDDLRIMLRSGEHLHTLINQVLDLAKIEAGRSMLNEIDFDLHTLLDELEEIFALKADDKGLLLLFERDGIPRFIRSDPVKLRQVLINLLGNAVKFTSEGKVILRVAALAESAGLRLHFSITDTGIGISSEEMDSLFNPFMQAQAGRRSREGTGLGLTISRNFVRLMGGDVHIESGPDQGTIIRFDIAAQMADATAGSVMPVGTTRRVVALAPGQQPQRILVVDDHNDARQLMTRLLTSLGFDVRGAANGQEAVDVWKAWQPHLIWMDMRMPVMDGRAAAYRIKADSAGNAPVIIALTASSFEEERVQILEAGCDDFLRKPFREEDLCALMQKHLGVRFVYEEEPSAAHVAPAPLNADALAAVPAGLLASLEQALCRLEPEAVAHAIAQISDKPLARVLETMANEFQYGRIRQLIRHVDRTQQR